MLTPVRRSQLDFKTFDSLVAAPGRHGPERRALPGNRKEVELSAGRHTFEYYHAASGPSAMRTP